MAECKICGYPYSTSRKCPNCGSTNPIGSSRGLLIFVGTLVVISLIKEAVGCGHSSPAAQTDSTFLRNSSADRQTETVPTEMNSSTGIQQSDTISYAMSTNADFQPDTVSTSNEYRLVDSKVMSDTFGVHKDSSTVQKPQHNVAEEDVGNDTTFVRTAPAKEGALINVFKQSTKRN